LLRWPNGIDIVGLRLLFDPKSIHQSIYEHEGNWFYIYQQGHIVISETIILPFDVNKTKLVKPPSCCSGWSRVFLVKLSHIFTVLQKYCYGFFNLMSHKYSFYSILSHNIVRLIETCNFLTFLYSRYECEIDVKITEISYEKK